MPYSRRGGAMRRREFVTFLGRSLLFTHVMLDNVEVAPPIRCQLFGRSNRLLRAPVGTASRPDLDCWILQ